MKNGIGILGLLICFLACSRSDDDMAINPDGAKNATALLNDSIWYGQGRASKEISLLRDTCHTNKFSLRISTELPYPKGLRKSAAYDCIGPCNTTQFLTFEKIPLVIGKYNIASLNSCSSYPFTAANYELLVGGDAIIAVYRAVGPDSGWIEVTRADTIASVVEGKFDLTLVSSTTKTVRFRDGRFSARLK